MTGEAHTPYPDSVTGFFMENLPQDLLRLFVTQKPLPLPQEAFSSFAARLDAPGAQRSYASSRALLHFAQSLDELMREFPAGCFARLGSRSPKDSFPQGKPLKMAKDVLILFDRSDRIRQDVTWCFLYDYAPVFWIRPWKNIAPQQEFRCIVKNRELYGISQYHTTDRPFFPEVSEGAKRLSKMLADYITEQVILKSPHADFACDLLYCDSKLCILDYNPLAAGTGMCLFDSRLAPPTVPQFRYVQDNLVCALPL